MLLLNQIQMKVLSKQKISIHKHNDDCKYFSTESLLIVIANLVFLELFYSTYLRFIELIPDVSQSKSTNANFIPFLKWHEFICCLKLLDRSNHDDLICHKFKKSIWKWTKSFNCSKNARFVIWKLCNAIFPFLIRCTLCVIFDRRMSVWTRPAPWDMRENCIKSVREFPHLLNADTFWKALRRLERVWGKEKRKYFSALVNTQPKLLAETKYSLNRKQLKRMHVQLSNFPGKAMKIHPSKWFSLT